MAGYDGRVSSVPPLPEHLERLCLRVEEMLKPTSVSLVASVPNLSQLAIKSLRWVYKRIYTHVCV